ncbi:MAG TPA: ArsR family transcriptional regulator [Candidatus Didemnitutus sp.]
MPRSVGQIFGLLFASLEPLSFSDIVERLGASKGSVSQGLQVLRSMGAVKVAPGGDREREHVPTRLGPRREYFEPELGLRRLVGGIVRGKVEPLVARERSLILSLRQLADSEKSDAVRRFQRQRIEQVQTWGLQMRLMLPLLKALVGARSR